MYREEQVINGALYRCLCARQICSYASFVEVLFKLFTTPATLFRVGEPPGDFRGSYIETSKLAYFDTRVCCLRDVWCCSTLKPLPTNYVYLIGLLLDRAVWSCERSMSEGNWSCWCIRFILLKSAIRTTDDI